MDVGSAGALLQTLGELLAKGVPLEQALPPFTSNPARFLRLSGRGSIEVGSAADLIALEATGAIETVIIGGRTHVRAGKPVVRGPFEP